MAADVSFSEFRPARTMTDYASAVLPDPGAGTRHDAFRAAGRHTFRVRLLRRTILFGAVGGSVVLLGAAFFNPFRAAAPALSVDSVGLNGTRITMDKPKLSGFRSDGRPYTLNARTAVQDARSPNTLELSDLDAHVTMSDHSVAHVVSNFALYDSSKETMALKQTVHMTSDSGYDIHMKSAFVAFKAGTVETEEPLTVVMSSGTVSADKMHMLDNGKEVIFEGHVHSVVLPPNAAAATVSSLKGTGQ